MEKYLIGIFDQVRQEQQEGQTPLCPRCGEHNLEPEMILNPRTRDNRADVYICDACGKAEAFSLKLQRLTQWHVVRKALEGKTFYDLLRSGADFDCGLIVGGVDQPDLCWDEQRDVTLYGREYFADIMEAPYTLHENGCIEVHNMGGEELSDIFGAAVAGDIGISQYNTYFRDMPFTANELVFDEDSGLSHINGSIGACFYPLFDVAEKIYMPHKIKKAMLQAVYVRESGALHLVFHIDVAGQKEARIIKYYPTQTEAEIVRGSMEVICKCKYGCGLSELDFSLLP